MATSRQMPEISSEKLSNEFLTCPLCFDLYNTPKVLHCQHTFCLSCLRQYAGSRGFASTLPCPLCKDVTNIPENDVSRLKNNYTIVNLLQCVEESWKIATEGNASRKSDSMSNVDGEAECGACNEVKDLIRFCESCCIWLCSTCTTSHKRVPVTSKHTLQSSQDIDVICKRMAALGEISVEEMKQFNNDKTELIFGQIEQLPVVVEATRVKIKTAGDSACHLIRQKESELLKQLESFERSQQDNFSEKLQVLDSRNAELSRILGVLNKIKSSTNAFQNHTNAALIEKDIKAIPPLENFPGNFNDFLSMSFMPYIAERSQLQHMNLGSLSIVKRFPDQHLPLQDHALQVHKIASLEEREYITSLAVNKFAEKFVVANNQSIFLFKPNSRQPKRFVPYQHFGSLKKPWGIAYCEVGKKIFITMAGENEGAGAVYVYSLDGTEQSVLASGLTLPRGIALHKGLVYVCDQIDKCVYVLNSDGSIFKLLKKLPNGNLLFNEPMFVSVGGDGRMAVSDSYCCVKIFDNRFYHIFTYTPNFLDCELWDVLVLHDGTTLVCDWKHGLHKISRDFQSNGLIAVEGEILHEPSALSSLENGNVIYIGNGMGEICSAI